MKFVNDAPKKIFNRSLVSYSILTHKDDLLIVLIQSHHINHWKTGLIKKYHMTYILLFYKYIYLFLFISCPAVSCA